MYIFERYALRVCSTMDYFSREIKSFCCISATTDQVRSCGTRIDGKENIENFHIALIIPLEKLSGVRIQLLNVTFVEMLISIC